MNLQKCNTVDDCVKFGKELELSHGKMFVRSTIQPSDNTLLISNYTSILTPYMDYINSALIDHTISDEDMTIYKYKPKYFCLQMYGTMELWSLLLRVNNMKSIMDFNKKQIKIFDELVIFDIINEIMILEKEKMELNNEEIDKKIIKMSTMTY